MQETSRGLADALAVHVSPASLCDDLDSLRNPDLPLCKSHVLSVVLKFLGCYRGAIQSMQAPPHQQCAAVLYDAMQADSLGMAQLMLADVFSTADLVWDILQTPALALYPQMLALDIGTGTGILLLALEVLACRHRVRDQIHFVGIECCSTTVQRTREVLSQVGLSDAMIRQADASVVSAYCDLPDVPLFAVANETIVSPGAPLDNEPFWNANVALFTRYNTGQLTSAHFFPRTLVAYHGQNNQHYHLNPEMGFVIPNFPSSDCRLLTPVKADFGSGLRDLTDFGRPFIEMVGAQPEVVREVVSTRWAGEPGWAVRRAMVHDDGPRYPAE